MSVSVCKALRALRGRIESTSKAHRGRIEGGRFHGLVAPECDGVQCLCGPLQVKRGCKAPWMAVQYCRAVDWAAIEYQQR